MGVCEQEMGELLQTTYQSKRSRDSVSAVGFLEQIQEMMLEPT